MAQGHGEILVYSNASGEVQLDVRLQDETVWLTQQRMAELFGTTVANINQHIKAIYNEGELEELATIKDFLIVRLEGGREVERQLKHYNLDMIISVGYRVKSKLATHFRIWATQRLREYLIKGFVMNDERLKNPPTPAHGTLPDYFDELLGRIRDIRASERRMYLRVRDIFAMAADYAPSEAETQRFFSKIQNKLHFAVTGLTAAEIIAQRADVNAPNMGLTSWRGDRVTKTDVTTAKNYLRAYEIEELNRIVTMWLDFAEDQAKRRKQVFMADWETKLDQFLEFNDRNILANAGSVSQEQAKALAHDQYKLFDQRRRELTESNAAQDYMDALEQAAKQIEDDAE